jgi:hypothetical protein
MENLEEADAAFDDLEGESLARFVQLPFLHVLMLPVPEEDAPSA